MADKSITFMNAKTSENFDERTRRREDVPGMVDITFGIDWLKNRPGAVARVTPDEAMRIAEQLIQSARYAMKKKVETQERLVQLSPSDRGVITEISKKAGL